MDGIGEGGGGVQYLDIEEVEDIHGGCSLGDKYLRKMVERGELNSVILGGMMLSFTKGWFLAGEGGFWLEDAEVKELTLVRNIPPLAYGRTRWFNTISKQQSLVSIFPFPVHYFKILRCFIAKSRVWTSCKLSIGRNNEIYSHK